MAERLEVIITAEDRASAPLRGVSGALGGVASVAGGILTAGLLTNITSQLGGMVRQAFDVTGAYQQLSLSMESLVARELRNTGAAENMSEALAMAGGRTQELLDWTQQLAILSPFGGEDISSAFRMALSMGFATDEAQRMTEAVLNMTTGMGLSGGAMQDVVSIMGQMSRTGTLLTQDIRQLETRGIAVTSVLEEAFGTSIDNINRQLQQGTITMDQVMDTLLTTFEEDFPNAAERAANTLGGLANSFGDIKDMALREFFGGMFDTAIPAASSFSDLIQDRMIPTLAEMGSQLGEALQPIAGVAGVIFSVLNNDVEGLQDNLAVLPEALRPFAANVSRLLAGDLDLGGFLNLTLPEGLMEDIQPLLDGFNDLRDSVASTIPDILPHIQELGDTIATAFGASTPQTIENVGLAFSSMAELWEQYGPGLVQGITSTLGIMAGLAGGFVSLLSGIISAGFQLLTGDTQGALSTLSGSVNSILAGFGLATTWAEVMAVWGANFEMLGAIITQWFENTGATWAQNWANMQAIVALLFENIRTGISETMQAVVSTVSTKIKDAIKSVHVAASEMYNAGINIVQGLIDGIMAKFGEAIAATAKLAQELMNTWNSITHTSSPSQEMFKRGAWFVEGLTGGIQAQSGQAVSAVSGLANTMMKPFSAGSMPLAAAGSSYQITVNYAPSASFADEREVKERLVPLLEDAIRQIDRGRTS